MRNVPLRSVTSLSTATLAALALLAAPALARPAASEPAASGPGAGGAGAKGTGAKSGGVEITWLGHAAFEIVTPKGTRLLIDPFVKGNPKTPKAWSDLARYGKKGHKPDLVLVTHSHGDHVGQAVEIAKKSKAPVVTSAAFSYSLELPDELKKAMNVGGKLVHKDVTVHMVPAMHGSAPGGRPVGFVVEVGAERIYHTGDTWIFGDMELIQLIHKPTILLLNTGGGPYTQDPPTAALAVERYFKPKHIIPMHFGTFGILADEKAVKKAFAKDKRLTVLVPGKPKRF